MTTENQLLALLGNRVSCPQLQAPGPDAEQLEAIAQAAFRAADHAGLKPWRYLVVEGKGLEQLGNLFLTAKLASDPDLEAQERERLLAMPLRAPMIIVAIASIREHPKVPAMEQYLSGAAAVQNILNATYALGLGAIWRTGELATNPAVKTGLGLARNEDILGFIYLGTPKVALRQASRLNSEDYFHTWPRP